MKTIVLDFGHGLPDPGAIGFVKEYQIVRMIGERIKSILENAGVRVVLTRTTDNAIVQPKNADINKRVEIANSVNADLVISLHMNAGGGHRFETYYSKNGSIDNRIISVHNSIMNFLKQHGITDGRILKSDQGQHTSIAILDRTKAKSMLLECLFVDHPDGKLFLDTNFLQGFSESVAKGILEALGIKYEPTPKKEVKTVITTNINIMLNDNIIGKGYANDGVSYVPVRVLAKALGLKVEWDENTKTVKLTK